MSVYATIKDTTIYPGGQGLLGPQTTLLTVVLPGLSLHWPQVEAALRTQSLQQLAGEEILDLRPEEWVRCLLAEPVPLRLSFAHWLSALCIAFQRSAGDPVGQGQVLWVEEDSARLALPWIRTDVLDGAVKMAVRHVMIHYEPDQERPEKESALAHDLKGWLQSAKPGGLSPNGMGLALAAWGRGIPVRVRAGFLQLGWGCQIERLDSTFTGKTSNIASKVARDKTLTKQLLWEAGMPVPEGTVARNQDQAMAFVRQVGWPVVVKPYNQDGGVAVTPGIYDEAELKIAFDKATSASGGAVIVERHIAGHDHRMLVVGGRLLAVTQRIPGGVVGDGQHTVAQLVDLTNQDPRRGRENYSPLIALDMDQEALICLRQQGLAEVTVLAPGQYAYLRRTANISTGGTALDMKGQTHPDNQILAERAARVIGLDIAGIDFICPDLSRSWTEVGGVICEVNGQPGLRVHRRGAPDQDLFGQVIEWISCHKNLRIPSAAITGTNGKTTVSRMLHHLWVTAGKVAGVTTTQGVWVGREQVSVQNLSGYHGATVLLDDPAVEVAVMELPRKGLIRFGHPCDRYDVAALLNVQDDHIGLDGIQSLQEMARLKAQVLERATQAVVVNAQDPLTLAMLVHAQSPRHILVSCDEEAPALLAHIRQGGEAVYVQMRQDVPWIIHAHGATKTEIMPLYDVPAMMNGLLAFNGSNVLFAVALGWAQGLPMPVIRQGMRTFINDEQHNIGRCNFLADLSFTAILDYGHNPDGIRALCALVQKLPVKGSLRLVSLNLANRHRQHFQMSAELLSKTFDHIVLGCDPGYAIQNPEYAGEDPVKTMLQIGRTHLLHAGIHEEALVTEADPVQALRTALAMARPGDALLILAEPALAMPVIREFRLSTQRHETGNA